MKKISKEYIPIVLTTIVSFVFSFIVFSYGVESLIHIHEKPIFIGIAVFAVLIILFGLIKWKQHLFTYGYICSLICIGIFYYYETYLRSDAILPSRIIMELELVNDYYGDSDGIYVAKESEYPGINKHGFRSRGFIEDGCDSNTPRILYLGDSFTWGAGAEPEEMAFPDLTNDAGYCVFNTGMPSTDPAQYAAVAKKYIPIIKPDLVLLMFCMDNDVMDCERPLKPHHPITYATNGVVNGLLLDGYVPNTCPMEPFETFEVALEYLTKYYMMHEETILGYTSIGTMLARRYKDPPDADLLIYPEYSVSDLYLNEVQAVCDSNGVKLWVYLIPSKADTIMQDVDWLVENTDRAFKEFVSDDIYCPNNLELSDYELDPGAHLNNAGHKKLSLNILEQLDKYFEDQLLGVEKGIRYFSSEPDSNKQF